MPRPVGEKVPDTRARFRILILKYGRVIPMAKPGRKSKGERDAWTCRTPPTLTKAIDAARAEVGLTRQDWVAMCLAEVLGMPEQAPPPRPVTDRPFEELRHTG